MWTVEPLKSQREFRSPVVWSRFFREPKVATHLFLKKTYKKTSMMPTKMVPNQPKKSLKHLGSCSIYSSNLAGCVIWRSLLKRSDFHPTLYLWELETGHEASEELLRSFGDEVFWAVSIFREVRSPWKPADIQNDAIFQISGQQKTRPTTGPGKAPLRIVRGNHLSYRENEGWCNIIIWKAESDSLDGPFQGPIIFGKSVR